MIGYRLDRQISNPVIYLGQFSDYHIQDIFEIMDLFSGGYRFRIPRRRSDWSVVVATQINCSIILSLSLSPLALRNPYWVCILQPSIGL